MDAGTGRRICRCFVREDFVKKSRVSVEIGEEVEVRQVWKGLRKEGLGL